MLLIQLLLTAMAVSMASAAPPEADPTTKVSAHQLPCACDVGTSHIGTPTSQAHGSCLRVRTHSSAHLAPRCRPGSQAALLGLQGMPGLGRKLPERARLLQVLASCTLSL